MRWLWNLWRSWRLRGKGLFNFHDGHRWRFVDIWLTYRKFVGRQDLDVERHLPLAELGHEPEVTELVAIICSVFGLYRWDGSRGLTDPEVLQVLREFLYVANGLKKNGSGGSTSSPTAAGSFSDDSTPDAAAAENSPSPSPCPPTDLAADAPSTVCSRYETPSA